MQVQELNVFSRRYDLIFVEEGRVGGKDVYWFIDFDNDRRWFTCEEIREKIKPYCITP
jgi:hypothetical protein